MTDTPRAPKLDSSKTDSDRSYPVRPFLAASVALLRGDNVLLASRGQPPFETVYSLPGGMVETGETLAEAALRELMEEVGLSAQLIGPLSPVEIIVQDVEGRIARHMVVIPFAANWTDGEPSTSPEAIDVRWVRQEDLSSLALTPDLERIVAEAFALRAHKGETA